MKKVRILNGRWSVNNRPSNKMTIEDWNYLNEVIRRFKRFKEYKNRKHGKLL